MRILVTGATGWIGSSIVERLLEVGHEVAGIVRTRENEELLRKKGVTPLVGDLSDEEFLDVSMRQIDAVVFAASASQQVTMKALDLFVTILEGTQNPLLYISGSSFYGDIRKHKEVDEAEFINRLQDRAMRNTPEYLVYSAGNRQVNGIILVGAGILYGRGGGATPQFLLQDAKARHAAWYIDSGEQRWSTGHVDDLAKLVTLAVENAPAFSVFNAVADAVPLSKVASVIAQATGVAQGAVSIPEATALREWGGFWGRTLGGNLWLSAELAHQTLGWTPNAISFAEDLLQGSYS